LVESGRYAVAGSEKEKEASTMRKIARCIAMWAVIVVVPVTTAGRCPHLCSTFPGHHFFCAPADNME
jgi:hypothetical protein